MKGNTHTFLIEFHITTKEENQEKRIWSYDHADGRVLRMTRVHVLDYVGRGRGRHVGLVAVGFDGKMTFGFSFLFFLHFLSPPSCREITGIDDCRHLGQRRSKVGTFIQVGLVDGMSDEYRLMARKFYWRLTNTWLSFQPVSGEVQEPCCAGRMRISLMAAWGGCDTA